MTDAHDLIKSMKGTEKSEDYNLLLQLLQCVNFLEYMTLYIFELICLICEISSEKKNSLPDNNWSMFTTGVIFETILQLLTFHSIYTS